VSVNTLGEHVEQYWLSDQEVGVLLRAVEEMLDCDTHSRLSDETIARLKRLSTMLYGDYS
jgi:hypothetical protein